MPFVYHQMIIQIQLANFKPFWDKFKFKNKESYLIMLSCQGIK